MKRLLMKSLLLISITLTLSSALQAQDSIPSLSTKPNRPDAFWRRIHVGGNLGFQFGSITGITISPEVSMRAIDQLYVGLRFIYQYYNYKNYYWDADAQQYLGYESSVYGGGIYLRYYLASLFDGFLANIYGHVEYEYQTYSRPYTYAVGGHIYDPYGNSFMPGRSIVEVNSFFVGGGYRQPISNRVAMDFLLLFNLNDSYNSPYSNPIFRLGVGVGL